MYAMCCYRLIVWLVLGVQVYVALAEVMEGKVYCIVNSRASVPSMSLP